MTAPIVEQHRGIIVVRDDLFPGGTKARYIGRVFDGATEAVYASPAEGGAQTALAHTARAMGTRATTFVARRVRPHLRTLEAARLGARSCPSRQAICRSCRAGPGNTAETPVRRSFRSARRSRAASRRSPRRRGRPGFSLMRSGAPRAPASSPGARAGLAEGAPPCRAGRPRPEAEGRGWGAHPCPRARLREDGEGGAAVSERPALRRQGLGDVRRAAWAGAGAVLERSTSAPAVTRDQASAGVSARASSAITQRSR